MKIAMFLDSVFPPDSRVENEAVGLIEQGHEVYLFSLNYDMRPERETIKGVHVWRYPAGKLLYKLSALAYSVPLYHMLLFRKIENFITTVQPDALHIHDMVIAGAVFRVNQKFSLPVILDLHENRPVIMKEYGHLQRFPGKYLIHPARWKRKQKELMSLADKIILVTHEAKREALHYNLFNGDRVIVVPNTIHLNIFKQYPIERNIESRFSDSFNIVYTGDTGLRRGTDTAIKAINILKKDIPEIKLILVGKNSEDNVLKDMVKALNLADNIVFEGWQDVSLFPSYIEVANICISPLKRNLHHDTTFANKIFQYMAMGKPLLVSNCPAQQHVIEDENCGLVHEADNEVHMADQIKILYNDPGLCADFGLNAFRAVTERWNWEVTQKDLIKLYETLDI